jgi:molybdate transport system ATP-binding protein
MTLGAAVEVAQGAFRLDAELTVEAGRTVAVVGPNGAGKTTLLRALAGLQALQAGRIELDGRVLDDPRAGIYVPPERRPIGMVFQEHRLFPHLSALENVAFGLRSRGMPRRDARRSSAGWLERVGLGDRHRALPRELSGGQAQRVALARALATDPALLLLDEPLAALDATTRGEVRRDLRRHLSSFAGMRVLVTHDPVDAAALADLVVVLDAGRVVQTGTPAEITARPRSRWVAELIGTNLFSGTSIGNGRIALGDGWTLVTADRLAPGPVLAVVPPRAVAVSRLRPDGSPRNTWPGQVAALDAVGDRVRVRVAASPPVVAEVTVAAVKDLALAEGTAVWVAVKATHIDVYPA